MLQDTKILPKARQDKLLVQAVGEELVVYDEEQHRAHCLNQATALVWRNCDGQTSISEMASLLQSELQLPSDEEVVWLALSQLEEAQLLQERMIRPLDMARISRRQLIQKLGLTAGFALVWPGVESIVSPERVMAQSPGDGEGFETCTGSCVQTDPITGGCPEGMRGASGNCPDVLPLGPRSCCEPDEPDSGGGGGPGGNGRSVCDVESFRREISRCFGVVRFCKDFCGERELTNWYVCGFCLSKRFPF